jgi:hypothetical protein
MYTWCCPHGAPLVFLFSMCTWFFLFFEGYLVLPTGRAVSRRACLQMRSGRRARYWACCVDKKKFKKN